MSVLSLLGVGVLVLIAVSVAVYKIRKASKEIDRLINDKQALIEQASKQAVVIEQKKAEVRHANTFRKNAESTRRSSGEHIDEQLQQQGWFRADDDHRVQCVRTDLSSTCGHAGNETSDTGTQSDL